MNSLFSNPNTKEELENDPMFPLMQMTRNTDIVRNNTDNDLQVLHQLFTAEFVPESQEEVSKLRKDYANLSKRVEELFNLATQIKFMFEKQQRNDIFQPQPVARQQYVKQEQQYQNTLVAKKQKDPSEKKTVQWTDAEHSRFLEALAMYNKKQHPQISQHVGTKDMRQCISHSQKFYLKLQKAISGATNEKLNLNQLQMVRESWKSVNIRFNFLEEFRAAYSDLLIQQIALVYEACRNVIITADYVASVDKVSQDTVYWVWSLV
ncbi:Myb-like_DNA-binding domain-containing protein [Hexamita inflata]|uniref:Myb-like DNA-binding domain-containing protein n=1 Tax=Hexamita inflata TaxID=28002 RepID=A0AA86QKL4_9EUKA|nr:Myb-like DNA-binding domain-containing protein [Hexamita inflata]CAI9961231.1 Myb-like DNA-binding domain-containing protein [Hexamita inflata]